MLETKTERLWKETYSHRFTGSAKSMWPLLTDEAGKGLRQGRQNTLLRKRDLWGVLQEEGHGMPVAAKLGIGKR